jgi:hypothetical protein
VKYLLDSNVFIEAKNRYYGFEFCPAYWDWLDHKHQEGSVFSVEKVLDEIRSGQDELAGWAGERSEMFLRPGPSDTDSLRATSEWTNAADYTSAAKRTFLEAADSFLVAQAHAAEVAVVTNEVTNGSRSRIKIPEACAGLEVRCIGPFEMLRLEQAQFVLPP